ncbi:DUF6292 family protein [Streptomyces sp. SBC-4]|nr:DUF6292 family protein [Streptomyces sp. SBC-4]MDV5143272.1 DUF6292 family protein [Streptomyces sp. SBC-4]
MKAFKESKALAGGSKGRPKGSKDRIPRDEIPTRVGELLDDDPGVTLATVQQRLGLSAAAAARALSRLRAERLADLLLTDPALTLEDAAARLGYPTAVQRTAFADATTELRARQVQPYLQHVADALAAAGRADRQDVRVHRLGPEPETLAAAVVLTGARIPALVWDERSGWRTATSRRHPIGKETGRRPEGDGIRSLGEEPQPDPADLLKRLKRLEQDTRSRDLPS